MSSFSYILIEKLKISSHQQITPHSFLSSSGFLGTLVSILMEKPPSTLYALHFSKSTTSEYLTNCLNPVENSTPEDEALNTVRTTLSTYFNERECHCLVKPLNDENQLKEISQVPVKKMKPLFMYSVYIPIPINISAKELMH